MRQRFVVPKARYDLFGGLRRQNNLTVSQRKKPIVEPAGNIRTADNKKHVSFSNNVRKRRNWIGSHADKLNITLPTVTDILVQRVADDPDDSAMVVSPGQINAFVTSVVDTIKAAATLSQRALALSGNVALIGGKAVWLTFEDFVKGNGWPGEARRILAHMVYLGYKAAARTPVIVFKVLRFAFKYGREVFEFVKALTTIVMGTLLVRNKTFLDYFLTTLHSSLSLLSDAFSMFPVPLFSVPSIATRVIDNMLLSFIHERERQHQQSLVGSLVNYFSST